ncbi:NUDIX domain-containing protein [Conexibacter stalactiti]|uniref:NUDIX domain-containing protein n=1 Tax=Conexibacter stalactiti TaxID=1940611 RepID=A0ABU4HQ22_9ACTN|nr:NUDIX domain-containing protein [Conexibacter stalactiti]MDW5595405.1 NUDIX domain-containing protein [Conexibacter stalactiti]MEC5036047.1 NUDIX domain-containing protein [Conexibacter stalactiti]
MSTAQTSRDAHVRILESTLLCDDWSELRRTHLELRGPDGSWTPQVRETYDRGNGATILLYEPTALTVVLVRQFRYPAYVNGHPDGMLLETPAGLLDGDAPEVAIRREAEEETGLRVGAVRRLFEVFMSPGSVTERVAFFAAPYSPADRVGAGGGVAAEGEQIEVVELPLAEALRAVERGEIVDGKTIMLLQWADRALAAPAPTAPVLTPEPPQC